MLYLDTSLVVTLLTSENETAKAQAWMRQHSAEQFAISDWVITEFSAALSMKVRLGFLRPEHRKTTQSWFDQLASETFERLLVSSDHFLFASRLAERSKTGLRGGDALHLAIAATASGTLCTRDKGLADAGAPLGIDTFLL
jgi:predicted nucleic acid-binding protein